MKLQRWNMGKTKLTLSNINGDTLYATDIIGREWCKGINDGYWFSCDNLNYLSEEDIELIVK